MKIIKTLSLLTYLLVTTKVYATESGADNIASGADTFFVVTPNINQVPDNTFAYNLYYEHYYSSHFANKNMKKFNVSSKLWMSRFDYISGIRVFNARLGAYVVLPYVEKRIRLGGRGNSISNFGDLTFAPLLVWGPTQAMNTALSLEITSPTGAYKKEQLANSGNGFFTIKPQLAFTWLPTEKSELSMKVDYNFNLKNHKSNYTSGQVFHFDYSASYEVYDGLHIGVNGFYLIQTTEDKKDGQIYMNGFKGRSIGFGPAIHYELPKHITVQFRFLKEFKVRNRPSGHEIWFKVAVPIGV